MAKGQQSKNGSNKPKLSAKEKKEKKKAKTAAKTAASAPLIAKKS